MNFKKGEVWFASFPYDDDSNSFSNRPVVVMDENNLGVLSVKITKHAVREYDSYDVPIVYWEEAGLKLASPARVAKVVVLQPDDFIFKIGNLNADDLEKVEEALVDYLKNNI